jgi:F0F1-type ATP synthase membrane subunit c/vacuolar-type H+-ATPase subunit K
MGLSTIGTGISAGRVGSASCKHIGNAPDIYPIISKIGLLALTMIDTFAIYGFIIAIILIYAI